MDAHDSAPHRQDAGAPEHTGGGLSRAVQLVADSYLLTVNPVDGSEIEPCPPGRQPGVPGKLDPAGRPLPQAAPGAGRAPAPGPLLEREEERERLVRLLTRGRSVRLTGPRGSGRTRVLDAVAHDVSALAPDGVIRLSGYRRTPTDLLHELFAAAHVPGGQDAPAHRPGPAELGEALARVGAVVVLDDLEFGGAALEELLRATPECAFLLAATPEVAAPAPESRVEEVFLAGLSRTAGLELVEHALHRPLTDREADWAADLWFETEGLPQHFVRAGALLRSRQAGAGEALPADAAALVQALAALQPDAGAQTLHLALALDGELPHHPHLPALTGDPHAGESPTELLSAGLVSPVGDHLVLAAGVAGPLTAAGYAEGGAAHATAVAQHYTWWAGHPSVTPAQVAAEADAVLAAVRGAQQAGNDSAAVLLARTAAPLLAAALRWSAWERILRHGQESARLSGEVAEEAYFHHDLGVLALTTGNPERARAELEAALGLRTTLGEQRGVFAARRALALITDRLGGPAAAPPPSPLSQAQSVATEGAEESAPPPVGATGPTAVVPAVPPADTTRVVPVADTTGVVPAAGSAAGTAAGSEGVASTRQTPSVSHSGGGHKHRSRAVFTGSRRNLAAAGAGALLAAVLGTVVTIGATSSDEDKPDTVRPQHTTSREDDGPVADERPGDDGNAPAAPQRPAAGTRTAPPPPSSSPDGDEDSEEPSQQPSSPDGDSSSPQDPPSSPHDPSTSPEDPPSTPDDPPSTPEDPPSSEDPSTPPGEDPSEDPPASSGPSGSSGTPRTGGGGRQDATAGGSAPSSSGQAPSSAGTTE